MFETARSLISNGQYIKGNRFSREILLQSLFYEVTRSAGLKLPSLHPVGGAANYGLLYLVTRILLENDIKRVLDIGAGQTSILLNSIREIRPLEVITLESDGDWAQYVQSRVAHSVLHRPLNEKEVRSHSVPAYLTEGLEGQFDLIIVDGPHGAARRSRWCSLDLLESYAASEYIVVFDDAERKGERDTIEEFCRMTSSSTSGTFLPKAIKQQFVGFTQRYAHLEFYSWL